MLSNLTFKQRMTLLVVLFLAALISTHLMYVLMLERLRINGPLYQRIAQGKDVVADVLPPPEYVIESYLTLLEMVTVSDASERQELIDKFNESGEDVLMGIAGEGTAVIPGHGKCQAHWRL